MAFIQITTIILIIITIIIIGILLIEIILMHILIKTGEIIKEIEIDII